MRIAQLVVDALFHGVELGHYKLGSFAVMANHVHVLLLPAISPSRLLKSLKGHTAREANGLLGRTGEPFWQRESYDHWVRDSDEFARIVAYIEKNPVKVGLVQREPKMARAIWGGVHKSVNAARNVRAPRGSNLS